MAPDLEEGGAELFESLSEATDSVEMTALITETARIKDRLDQLHRVLSGEDDVWMRLAPVRGSDDVLEIKIDSALTEARQLATVFRQMLAEIARRRREDGAPNGDDPLDRL